MKKSLVSTGIVLAMAAVTLAGCGAQQAASTAPQAGAGGGQNGQNGQGRRPGVFGTIAAVQGSTMQVQGSNSQTAVTWSGTTSFTKQVAGSAGDVTTGVCVMVRSASTQTPGASPSARPTAQPTQLAAASVVITQPTNGSCTAGFGGASGTRTPNPSATRTPNPSSTRTPRAGGQGGAGFGGAAQGQVASVTGSTFVVTEQRGGSSTQITVTTDGSTTYAKTVPATADDVKTGECASAQGKTDDTGAVAATSVALSDEVNGACRNG